MTDRPEDIFRALEAVRATGLVNMSDSMQVSKVLDSLGYHECARYVDGDGLHRFEQRERYGGLLIDYARWREESAAARKPGTLMHAEEALPDEMEAIHNRKAMQGRVIRKILMHPNTYAKLCADPDLEGSEVKRLSSPCDLVEEGTAVLQYVDGDNSPS